MKQYNLYFQNHHKNQISIILQREMSELKDITVPPTEIRTLIGKTAIYVNKNGIAFENKIKSKESKNHKFFFLNSNDPYNAYYLYALKSVKETGKPPMINNENEDKIKQEMISKTKNEVNNNEITKPNDYKFLKISNNQLDYAEFKISNLDLKIIKLVAQFAVINGEEIMEKFKLNALSNKKLSIQFEFLKPEHSMNPIYNKYYNIYKTIWINKKELIEEYSKNTDIYEKLNECFGRAEYLEKESIDVKEIEEKKLLERIKYGSIDWQDFEIVETINFTELDEVSELNLPLVKSDLEYRSLLEKGNNSIFSQIKQASELVDELEQFEDENINNIEEDNDNNVNPNEDDQIPQYKDEEDEDEEKEDDRNEAEVRKVETKEVETQNTSKKAPKGMKIKSAGESRLLKRRYKQIDNELIIDPVTKEKLLKCPLTDKLIPESKFQGYINTLLRDPKYVEEKARYESKFKYGSNITTEQVYENIQRLVQDKSNKKKK